MRQEVAGTHLRESLLVDDHDAFHADIAAAEASTPRIDSTLVYPTPATFTMNGSFFHSEYPERHPISLGRSLFAP